MITIDNCPIVICTYKNRESLTLGNLDKLKPYNIFLFIRRDDFYESEYDKYDFPDNVNIELIDNVTNINNTREKAVSIMQSKGYDYMFMIDDDIYLDHAYKISSKGLRPSGKTHRLEKIPIVELFNKIIDTANEYNASFCSPQIEYNVGFNKPGQVFVNTRLTFGTFVWLNIKDMKEYNIHYDDETKHVAEDMDIVLQMMWKGLTCITVGDYAFKWKFDKRQKHVGSTVGDEEHYKRYKMGIYNKWKDYINVCVRRGKVIFKPRYKEIVGKYPEEYIIDTPFYRNLKDISKTFDTKAFHEYLLNVPRVEPPKRRYGPRKKKKIE